jgi:hypothetical protein
MPGANYLMDDVLVRRAGESETYVRGSGGGLSWSELGQSGKGIAAESWGSVQQRDPQCAQGARPGGKPPRVGRSASLVLGSYDAEQSLED